MDLLNLLPSDNAAITLKHPVSKSELEGMTISVSGHDSATFKNAIKERAKAQMSRKSADVDFIANDKEAVELLAKCTTGWTGITEGGKELPFSLANAIYIYTKYNWIREQIDNAIGDRANFFMSA